MTLPPSIYSPEQVDAYAMELGAYLSWLHKQGIRQQVGADPSTDEPPLSKELVDYIMDEHAGSTSMATLEKVKADFDRLTSHAPIVTVTLAALPGPGVRKQLAAWFREQISPEVLISFEANRNILGGVIVRTRNRLYDFSFRKRLLDNREKLGEIVAGVR